MARRLSATSVVAPQSSSSGSVPSASRCRHASKRPPPANASPDPTNVRRTEDTPSLLHSRPGRCSVPAASPPIRKSGAELDRDHSEGCALRACVWLVLVSSVGVLGAAEPAQARGHVGGQVVVY